MDCEATEFDDGAARNPRAVRLAIALGTAREVAEFELVGDDGDSALI